MKKIIFYFVRRLQSILNTVANTDYANTNWHSINMNNFKQHNVKLGSIKYINGLIKIINTGSITIGNDFQANSGENFNEIGGDTILRIISYKKEAQIIIGDNVGISNSTIVCWNKIVIGSNVTIGGSVKIWDTNFHSLDPNIRVSNYDNDRQTSPIHIGDYAFIGGGSIILKGVNIGRYAIIAAGSVVVKDIPENAIAGGNPCKVIKYSVE